MPSSDETKPALQESGDCDPAPTLIGSRRRFLATTTAVTIAGLAGSSIVRQSMASDDDDDNSGPGGGEDNGEDYSSHGLPPDQSPQVTGVTTVEIVDERFEPNNIRVATGAIVTWQNRDDDLHTASGRGMDTGVIEPGSQGEVIFLEPGEFNYTCNYHPEMRGKVTVVGESLSSPTAESYDQSATAPQAASVEIVDFTFEPAVAQVAIGGTVTWTNNGAAPHSVLADWADSDILDPGADFAFTFEEAGRFEYQCGLHPGMSGVVEVVTPGLTGIASPVAGDESDPVGVWLFTVEVDDTDAFPFATGLVNVLAEGRVTCVFMTEALPTPLMAFGTWLDQGEVGIAIDAIGSFNREETANYFAASVHFSDLLIDGDEIEGDVEAAVTSMDGSVSRTRGSVTAVRL